MTSPTAFQPSQGGIVQFEKRHPLPSSRDRLIVGPMPEVSRRALIDAYQAQIDWLMAQADDFEAELRRVSGKVAGKEADLTRAFAAEYRHKAANMKAILLAYERLNAKDI